MSGSASRAVGLSQRIRLEWLDEAAALARAGRDRAQAWSALAEMLRDKVSVDGTSPRGNREKTVTILTRIWCEPPPRLLPLRNAGLRFLDEIGSAGAGEPVSVGEAPAVEDPVETTAEAMEPPGVTEPAATTEPAGAMESTERLAVHWGMTMAVYPFWHAVATQVGRLLRLHGVATAAQVRRRVQEQYGERPTVARATRRVVRSFVDWGVLADTGTRGRYVAVEPCPVRAPALVAWLAEAALHGRDGDLGAPVQELLGQPGLFPFRVSYVTARGLVGESPRLDMAHQGLDTEVVGLRARTDREILGTAGIGVSDVLRCQKTTSKRVLSSAGDGTSGFFRCARSFFTKGQT